MPGNGQRGTLGGVEQGRTLGIKYRRHLRPLYTQLGGTVTGVGTAISAALGAATDDADQAIEGAIDLARMQHRPNQATQAVT